jgi:hypothetical protein
MYFSFVSLNRDSYKLDKKNSNTKWQDAMQAEINSLLDHSTFEDKGKIKYLTGYKNIRVHFVFVVKHDLCHKLGFWRSFDQPQHH